MLYSTMQVAQKMLNTVCEISPPGGPYMYTSDWQLPVFYSLSITNHQKSYLHLGLTNYKYWSTVTAADPGFPVGGAPTLQEGAPAYDFANNFQKNPWNSENFGP